MYYYIRFWKRVFDFTGLSSFSEYFVPWIFHFGLFIISFIIFVPFGKTDIFLWIIKIYFAMAALPLLSSTIRRLYDNNVSRLNILWMFIPLLGQFILITMLIYESQTESSKEDFQVKQNKINSSSLTRNSRGINGAIRSITRRRR